MLRSLVMALAALLLAAAIMFAPARALAGGSFGGLRWDYYGGRFLVSNTQPYGHEYMSFNPSCAWLRRLVRTPLGPQWQLVPVCV